jgi:hypothetical protein
VAISEIMAGAGSRNRTGTGLELDWNQTGIRLDGDFRIRHGKPRTVTRDLRGKFDQ